MKSFYSWPVHISVLLHAYEFEARDDEIGNFSPRMTRWIIRTGCMDCGFGNPE